MQQRSRTVRPDGSKKISRMTSLQAADEVLAGQHRQNFVVDPYQAGAGTSHNMNINEVLANRANEILGEPRGGYTPVHPNDHVNMAQSTNDVIPTAIRLASVTELPKFVDAFERLIASLEQKGREFDGVMKSGRTHLQDATPIRLGQEFTRLCWNSSSRAQARGQSADYLRISGLAEAQSARA